MSRPCGGSVIPSANLELIKPKSSKSKTKNVLFLGDGFAASDKGRFEEITLKLRKAFIRDRPFNLVKSRFNFFRAFTPSNDSGISYIEAQFTSASGRCDTLVDGRVNSDGVPDLTSGMTLREKDTVFGMMYNRCERPRTVWDPDFNGVPRLESKFGYEDCVIRFVQSLRYPPDPLLPKDPSIPKCWDLTPGIVDRVKGRDRGLVCVLVNDDHFAANSIPSRPGFTLPVTKGAYIAVSLGSDLKFDVSTISPIFPATTPTEYDHTPSSHTRDYHRRILDVILHEFGHTNFRLGDEAGGSNDPNARNQQTDDSRPSRTVTRTCVTTTPDFTNKLCEFSNITTAHDISLLPNPPLTAPRPPTPRINVAELKWNEDLYTGSPHNLIPPLVMDYITGVGSSFTENGALFNYSPGFGARAERPLDHGPLVRELEARFGVIHPSRIIGLFEGGGYYNSGVYTPSGKCKMRSAVQVEIISPTRLLLKKVKNNFFCYVCQKRIIQKLRHDGILNDSERDAILKTLAHNYDPYVGRRKDHV